MGRGVFADELAGGDGSAKSLAKTKTNQAERAKSKAKQPQGGGGPAFTMPKFEMPNPFGGKPANN